MIKRLYNFVFDNSLLLLAGAVAAMLWANLDPEGYRHFTHLPLLMDSSIGILRDGRRVLDLHYLVNDILMAFFFALAGREVWDALLPGGQLHSPRRAATPILCAMGGMLGPALIYLGGVYFSGRMDLARGWAIPTATDIAFSYSVGRMVFGERHGAMIFLLLLAIVDDALGLAILAVFYPLETVHPEWLLLCLLAMAIGVGLWHLRVRGFWWYLLLPGTISWMGFAFSGLHPALGLLPIVPILPHVHINTLRDGWDFIRTSDQHQFEHMLKRPVEVVLGLFGLFNAGVVLHIPTGQEVLVASLVLGGLLVGKPLGIVLSGLLALALGLSLGKHVGLKDLLVVGVVAGVGFTVALFMAVAAFEEGVVQEAAKLGALGSLSAAAVALLLGRLLGIRRRPVLHDHRPHPEAWEEANGD